MSTETHITVTQHPAVEQGSPEWLELRRGVLTASVIGRLITMQPPHATDYPCPTCNAPAGASCVHAKTGKDIASLHDDRKAAARDSGDPSKPVPSLGDEAHKLALTIAAERITGHVIETPMTRAMWRGREEEPLARDAYTEHYEAVEEVGFITAETATWRIGYSPDGLVGDNGLIEIKSREQQVQVRHVLDGDVPPENMAQIQTGLLVTRRDWCDYVSYSSGMALWGVRVYPDAAWGTALTAAAEQFEQEVATITERYHAAVAGLPVMPRTPEYGEIF